MIQNHAIYYFYQKICSKMNEASFWGFFRTLIWIVGIYYVLKFLARLLMPILFRKMVAKTQQRFYEFQKQNNTSSSSQKDKFKETKKLGEYIDYEEVK